MELIRIIEYLTIIHYLIIFALEFGFGLLQKQGSSTGNESFLMKHHHVLM